MSDILPPEAFDRKHWITSAWARGARGLGITVAVIDETLDPESPSLEGYVDETIDFQGNVVPRSDSHGSEVARLIRMFAPDCRIVGINVFPSGCDWTTYAYNKSVRAAATEAVRYCLDAWPRIQIINMSFNVPRGRTLGFGGCRPSRRCSLCFSVNEARVRGIIPVAAAGNCGPRYDTMECPAVAEGAETIGALLSKADTQALQIAKGEDRRRFGTSWAAAYFSGSVAALMSACPNCSVQEILDAYTASCSPLPGFKSLGRANLTIAVANLIGVEPESLDISWQRIYAAQPNDWANSDGDEGQRLRSAIELLLIHARALLRLDDTVGAQTLMERLDESVPWTAVAVEFSERAAAIRQQLKSAATA